MDFPGAGEGQGGESRTEEVTAMEDMPREGVQDGCHHHTRERENRNEVP